MKAEDVKIGMKVKIASNPPECNYGHGQVGNIIIITHAQSQLGIFGASGFTGKFGGKDGYIDCQYFEPAAFTRDMLKTGMRVVYREGVARVVSRGAFRGPNGGAVVDDFMKSFTQDLYSAHGAPSMDIMEVYAAPANCEDFFNLDEKGELLFKREESPKKTAKQKKAEELLAEADKLKAQFEALVKQATDLAGE